ncbi:hypothetical protein [Okeania sp.]|uniref:hypothetical protein n=1 Tax=Okeania sp. TaxID=3100323 RepID=UPI002B4B38F8|nr:hypothetical protein [Okeania sp.]MEB3339993.1 hypothetical protein [Okeania sp.]
MRFGITSLRRTIYSLYLKCFDQYNDDNLTNILPSRVQENLEVKEDSKVDENIDDNRLITD